MTSIMFTKLVKTDIPVKYLQVKARNIYWEDGLIDGKPDDDGAKTPCKNGEMWEPKIELSTGKIVNWTTGVTADIHYKVCDAGTYILIGENGEEVSRLENSYVISMLCPKDSGWGDYIIMDIDVDGKISEWEIDLNEFYEEEKNKLEEQT